MQLFLTSTVKRPNVVDAMKEFVGGFNNKRMVYIPTAAHSEEGFGVYKTGGTFTLMSSLVSNLEILELEFVTDEQAQQSINKTDILFMAGGFPVYLSYWLHRRGLKDLIKRRIKDGMYYIGTSAGAMVCSKTLRCMKRFANEPYADVAYGLGYIDYEIWPHYLDEHNQLIDAEYGHINIKPLRDGEYVIESLTD